MEHRTAILPWRVEEMDFDRIDRARVADNEELYFVVCAASFIESCSDLFTNNLVAYYAGDDEVTRWLTQQWEVEELQHGRALRVYVEAAWPAFDWQTVFTGFFAEYSQFCRVDKFEKTRALEMASRCVVEMTTATLYQAIRDCTDEPVLKELTEHIRCDEVRHYKYFHQYFKTYKALEKTGRFKVLGALMRRLLELRQEEFEIALRHIYCATYPEAAHDTARQHALIARAQRLVRRHLPLDMSIKMLLKPLDLPPRLQQGLFYPITKLAERILLR